MKEKKAVWLLPSRFVTPEALEAYREKIAMEGGNISHISQWSSLRMVFQKSEPRKYRYVVEVNPFPKQDYQQRCEAFGWELVGKMASMFVWRMEYEGERPEPYAEPGSLAERNGNLKKVFGWLIAGLILAFGFLTAAFVVWHGYQEFNACLGYGITGVLLLVFVLVLSVSRRKLAKS